MVRRPRPHDHESPERQVTDQSDRDEMLTCAEAIELKPALAVRGDSGGIEADFGPGERHAP
jgi:hypothetical protein